MKTKILRKKPNQKKQNNFQKNYRNQDKALTQRNVEQRGVWLYGKHPIFLALQKKRREIFEILATRNSAIELEKFLVQKNIPQYKTKIRIVESDEIQAIVGRDQIHQGLALNCSVIPSKSQNHLLDELQKIINAEKKLPPLLIMDQLRDPHNVGASIRSACAFGFKKIIFPEHNFPKETAVMNKSSSGMIENVDLYLVVNLSNLMMKLKELGYWCIGLAGEGIEMVDKIKEYKNVALIVGSEGEGIRDLVKKNCDLLVKIKIDDDVESLNASVAASIALREIALNS